MYDYSLHLTIDPSQYHEEWSLESGWVAEEGKALLPPKAMGRANLLDCYSAFILAAFMESNLFPSLVKVVKVCEPCISVMATILIGELLHLVRIHVQYITLCFILHVQTL